MRMFLCILLLSFFPLAVLGTNTECPALSFPENGRVDYDPTVGEFAAYTCNDGYKMNGTNYLLCQANYTWSGDPPTCQIEDCGDLSNPENGVVEYNLTTYGEAANYSCNTGYTIGSGNAVRYCVDGGSWNGTEANCTDIDECSIGTSTCDSNATCSNTIGSFTCTCIPGFSGDGENCTDIDECILGTSNCDSNATCTNTIGSFTCTCDDGFSGNGTTCSDIDECTLGTHNCSSNAVCTNTIGSFTCACNSGFTGDGFNCTDIDECTSMYVPSNCSSNATCTNTVGSYTCTCNDGFSGDGVNCADIDECTLGTHNCTSNATCTNLVGSFICTCSPGFTGDGQQNCTDLDECTLGTSNCDSNANCTNTIGSYICTCLNGFSGDGENCTDIDECTLGTHTCDSNADCTNIIGSFVCTCTPGFSGNGTVCSDIDECTMGTHNCSSNATCTNTVGSFTCTCDDGFSGDGENCTDIDECTLGTHNCSSNAICTNTIGSFTCACNGGFSGDGFNCTDIDECSIGTQNCSSNATCTNTVGSFTCTCNSGFTGDGENCTDIDECISNPCLNMGYCINGIDMFTCNCTPGFTNVNCTPSVLYDDCSTRSEVCDGIPNAECNGTVCACSTGHYDPGNATCVPVDCGSLNHPANGQVDTDAGTTYNLAATYTCDTGYNLTGSRIRFCLENGSWAEEDPMCILDDCGPLTNITNGYVSTPGGTTYNQTATYVCDTGYFISAGNESRVCQDGGAWSGIDPNCTIYDCGPLSNITNGIVSTIGGTTYSQIANYTCVTGYFIDTGDQIRVCLGDGNWNGTEPTCSDIDECSLGTSTCDSNATCSNNVGSFNCSCNDGFTGNGTTCSDIDECTLGTSNCDSNANCTNTVGSFTCTCSDGFSGNGTACSDIDECTLGSSDCDSNANCTNTVGSFTCTCINGFSGNGKNCTDIDECILGTHTCDSNATCTNTIGSFTCTCNTGFTGNGTACSDIDECTLGTHNCSSNASCNNTVGSFTCACNSGFSGDGFNCTDVDECTLGTHNCSSNATCTNTVGSFTCTCNSGFTGDGVNCTDIDECISNPCLNNGTCINGIDMFTCNCTPGFTNINCTPSVLYDDCSTRSDVCDGIPNAACNGTVCACSTGHYDPGNATCVPVDCGSLSHPANGRVDTDAGTTYNLAATYTCDTGYNLTGSRIRFCLENGSWAEEDPMCILDDCGPLINITNGYVTTPEGTTYNQTATYVCDTGYFISAGNESRVCQDGGAWSGIEPNCTIYDCGSLSNITNGIVTYMGSTFGEIANYTCDTGYFLDGGDASRTCGNGTWNGIEPNCTIYDCGTLNTTMANGTVVNTGWSVYQGTYNYTCDTGFYIVQGVVTLTLTCLSNGSWDGTVPTCTPVDCGNPEAPENGQVNTEPGTSYLDFASYTCNHGYLLSGSNVRQCQADGTYEFSTPVCNLIDCGNLTDPVNGNVTMLNGTTFGQIAVYICDTGYQAINGSLQRTCSIYGNWTGSEPFCEIYDCGILSTNISNGNATQTGTVYQSITTYTCDLGYWIMPYNVTEFNVTCNSTGSWDSGVPLCVIIDCGPLSAPVGGQINAPNTTYNSVASYTCDTANGWTLNGTNARTCGLDGQWSEESPICIPIDCGNLTSISNGNFTLSQSTYYNSVATYSCYVGYYLVGNTERVCQLNSTWNGTDPTCFIHDCGNLTRPENGSMNLTGTTYRETASFYCDEGFDLNGTSLITCLDNGNWSDSTPYCQIKDCGDLTSGNMTYYNISVSGNSSTLGLLINPGNYTSYSNLTHVISGTIQLNGTTYSQTAMFYCFIGFRMIGSNETTCQSNGNWSSDVPTCLLIDCGPLSNPVDGEVTLSNGTFYNSTANYTCNLGYYLEGDNTRVCDGYGNWTGTSPTCTIHDCGTLTAPSNVNTIVSTTTYGSVAQFSCSVGYNLTGEDKIVCQANGNWSAREPTCELVDCGPLSSPQNGNVSVMATTFNQFANYSCNPGYTLSGSSVRICQSNGQWSGTAATCSPKDCGPLSPPMNGYVNVSEGTLFGSTAYYSCDIGHQLDGPNSTFCATSGTWDPLTAPTCTIRDCGPLVTPDNGQIDTSSGTTYGQTAIFSCNPGYTLIGQNISTCQEDGQWNVTSFSCQIKDCGSVSAPTQGNITLTNGTEYGSLVTFYCSTGYYLNGTREYNCTETGQWSVNGAWPDCILIDCGDLRSGIMTYYNMSVSGNLSTTGLLINPGNYTSYSNLTHVISGIIKLNGTTYSQTAMFYCFVGFRMIGSNESTCQSNGNWSSDVPSCLLIDCGPLGNPVDGEITLSNGTFYNSRANYTCNLGYYLDGDSTRVCDGYGNWTGSNPTCIIHDCGPLSAPRNGSVIVSTTTYGSVAEFSCSVGYNLTGEDKIVCQANGNWSAPEPTCQLIDCGPLSSPQNGNISVIATTFNKFANYSCNPGYTLSGSSVRICQSNGQWSGTIATCIPKDCGPLTPPMNGYVNVSEGTLFGSTAYYRCDIGHQLDGPNSTFCSTSGTWDPLTAPTCTIRDCGPLVTPDNGQIDTSSGTTYGQTAIFSCNPGYTLIGQNMSTCQEDGQWNVTSFSCQIKDCGLVNAPAQGNIRFTNGTVYGSLVTFYCDTGYYLNGTREYNCTETGQWSINGTFWPSCILVDCGDLRSGIMTYYNMSVFGNLSTTGLLINPGNYTSYSNLTHVISGIIELNGTTYSQTAMFYCFVGFRMIGSNESSCQSNGNWSSDVPSCLLIDCGPLGNPVDGEVTLSNGTFYNSNANYTCNLGYYFEGDSTRVCDGYSNWTGSSPICTIHDCGPLLAPRNGSVIVSTTTYGSVAEFSCSVGYNLTEEDKIVCQANGNWSAPEQTCQLIDCGPLSSPQNGNISVIATTFNKFANYSCNPGYTLSGSSVRICQSNGQWSGTVATCIPKDCGPLTPPMNGYVNVSEGTLFGSTAYYRCDIGHQLDGPNSTFCSTSGTWDPLTAPTCTIRDCGPLVTPDNGQIDTSSGTTYGQTAIFSCNPGYTLIGQNMSTCQEDGQWNVTNFSCQIKDCGSVTAPAQGNITLTNGTVYGSVVTFYCNTGYYLNGTREYNCTETGQWSVNGAWPDCILVDCGNLTSRKITYYNMSVSGNLSTTGLLINPGNHTSYNNLIHVISGRIELNGTTYGQTAMFYCFVGFTMLGSNESTCQSNGNWSFDVPTCLLIDCGPLSNPVDGEVTLSNGTFYNSTANYTCNLGYFLEGDSTRICDGYGNWTGSSPTCKIQNCGPLTSPTNGNMAVTATTFGSIAEFSCSRGYDLFGVDKVVCQPDGNWSAPEPTCELTDCGSLSSPANGTISVVVTTFNQFANYSCNSGYILSGSSVRICQSNGQWSGTVPTCIPKDCGQLLPPINGFVNTSAGTIFGNTAVYGCNIGYRLDGPKSTTCSSSGSWDPPSAPFCSIRDCGQLAHPVNGQVDISFGTTYNTTAMFKCNIGYTLIGSNTTLCQADGQWNFTNVTCLIKDCGTIKAPTDGTLSFTRGTVYGSIVTFSCNTGYYLNGTSVYNCTETGEWSLNGTWPVCVLYDCGNLTAPMNGDVAYLNSLGSKYGGQAMYSCNRGYTLNGTEIIQCTSTGSWSLTEPPICEIKDCGAIFAPANGSMTLTNGTVFEAVASFTCDPGFNMTGQAVINCTDTGMWSNAEPVCMPFDCGPLKSPANGNISLTYGTLFTSMASYNCDVGYNLTGPQTRECTLTGQWEPTVTSSPTTCVIIDCGTIQHPENGNVDLINGTTYGQTAVFTCSVGFEVFGSSNITCQSDGQWSSNPPTCQITDCGGLNDPDNGSVTATNTTFGQIAQYSCRVGFYISAETTRVCQPDGDWSLPIPTCTIRDCGQLPEFQFGSISLSTGTTFGSVATYSCNIGYNMQGNSTQTCTANGTWDGMPPVCTIHDCGNVPTVNNSVMSSNNSTTFGTVLTYTCVVGYNMSGSSNVSCTPTGWDPAPTCFIMDCGVLSDPTDGYVIVRGGTTYGQTAIYYCNTGYILVGSNQQTCIETGQWNSSAPTCRKADCGQPDPITNGEVTLEPDTTYGSTALYVCNVGYQLNGSSSLFCQVNESWSGVAPVCTIRDCGPLSDPMHGNVTLNATTYGSVAVYACNSLYNLVGASTVICRSNGSWSDGPPECVLTDNAQDVDVQMSINVIVIGNLSNPTVYEAYKQETEQSLTTEYTSVMGSDLLGVDVTGLSTGSLIANFTVVVKDTSQATQSLSRTLANQLQGSNLSLFNQPVNATLMSVGNSQDCGTPSNITNGIVETPQGTKFGSTIIYTCNEGYTLVGFNTRTCLLNGSYASTEPVCTPKDCGPLSNPTNGQVTIQSGTTVGNVALFTCDPGYSLIGQSQIICQISGNWSDNPPTCQFTLCGGLENPSNGKVSLSTDGRTATYTCDDGYLLQGTNARVCSVVTASWTGTQPTCLQIDCGILLDPENGIVDITSGTTFGKVATYTCVTAGYVLIGPEERVCGSSGWNGTKPVCSLADCGEVNPILNGQLNLTGRTFGNTATYVCDAGYRIIGQPVLSCTLTGWNFQEPICFPTSSCPDLTNPINGVVTIAGGNSYGTQAYYQCYTGYVLNGTSVRTCLTNGTWSGEAPTCNIQECPLLLDPVGGDFRMPNGNTYAKTAFYMCDRGYSMIGPQVVTCQQDGTWSHITTCQIKDCGPAPTLGNGNVETLAGTTYNSTAVYTCNPGYDLDGQSEIKCLDTGSWENNLTTCKIRDCGPLEHPDNGFVNLTGSTYGQTAIYGCDTGYNLTGSRIRQCTEFGVWTGSKPFCNVIECGPAPSIINGQVSLSNGFSYGSVITYSCNHGFALSTSIVTSVCTETGSWSNMNPPTCQLVDCGSLTAPAHGQVILFNDTLYGSTAQYSCIKGYMVVGNPVRNCTASGQWTEYIPTCVVADCGLLTDPVNGDVELTGGTIYGATAVYKCNSQHNLKGTATRTCGENGSWTGDPPRCDSTEFALAVGLGVGVTGFVLLVIIIALIVAIMYKRHVRKREARRQRYRKMTRNTGIPVSSVPLKATTSSYIVPYINRSAWYSNNHLADGSISSYDDWKRWKADDGDPTNPLYNNATIYQNFAREEESQGNPTYTYY